MSDSPDKIGENRQPDGRFGPGNIANPNGRPKGTFSLISLLRSELQKVPAGQQRTHAEMLIQRILKSAISDGNDQQIKNILQYIEGMPKQSIDHGLSDTLASFLGSQVVDPEEIPHDTGTDTPKDQS